MCPAIPYRTRPHRIQPHTSVPDNALPNNIAPNLIIIFLIVKAILFGRMHNYELRYRTVPFVHYVQLMNLFSIYLHIPYISHLMFFNLYIHIHIWFVNITLPYITCPKNTTPHITIPQHIPPIFLLMSLLCHIVFISTKGITLS